MEALREVTILETMTHEMAGELIALGLTPQLLEGYHQERKMENLHSLFESKINHFCYKHNYVGNVLRDLCSRWPLRS